MQANEAGRRRSSLPPPTTRRPTSSPRSGQGSTDDSTGDKAGTNDAQPTSPGQNWSIASQDEKGRATQSAAHPAFSQAAGYSHVAARNEPNPDPPLRGRGARRGNGRKAAPLSDSRRLPATPAAAAWPAAATARPVSEAAHATPHHRHAERSARPCQRGRPDTQSSTTPDALI